MRNYGYKRSEISGHFTYELRGFAPTGILEDWNGGTLG
jgi:hypothetical protein